MDIVILRDSCVSSMRMRIGPAISPEVSCIKLKSSDTGYMSFDTDSSSDIPLNERARVFGYDDAKGTLAPD